MKLTKSITQRRLLGFSIVLMLALLAVVNIVTANTPTRGQEETPEAPILVETEDTSVEDTSTEVAPVEDTSTEDTSVEDTSTEDTSVEDTSTEVAPVEDTSTENVENGASGVVKPAAFQTTCAMQIDDQGDNDPYTYTFSAVNTNNILSYSWDFGHAPGGTGVGQTVAHNFPNVPTPETYVITLTCHPDPAYSTTDIVLTGSISITPPSPLTFTLSPGQVVTNNGPFMFTGNLNFDASNTYEWCITDSTAPVPPGVFNGANCLQFGNATGNTFTYNFAEYAQTHYIHLKRTTGGGSVTVATLSFLLNATAPTANFNLSTTSGTDPLNVTVTGTDGLTGPIDFYEFVVTSDTPATCPPGVCTTHTPATLTTPFDLNGLPVGLYTIRLNYSGPGGSGFVVKSVLVYALEPEVQALFEIVYGDNVYDGGGNIIGRRVCFVNTSGGPYVASFWDLDGDGSPDDTDLPTPTSDTPEGGDPNAPVVCYVYPDTAFGTSINVRLIVVGSDPAAVNSSTTRNIFIRAKPIAEFSWSPDPTEWGNFVNFTDETIGTVDEWEWEFDYGNTGTFDATSALQNPSNIQLPLGVSRVRLTVRNSITGEFDVIEKFVVVTRKDITCDISGALIITPATANPQNYLSVVGGLNGNDFGTRTATYSWSINGVEVSTDQNLTGINWDDYGFGTHNISLIVTASDGTSCARSVTVNYDFAPLDCRAIIVTGTGLGTPPYTFYPNNLPVTFTVDLAPLGAGQTLLGYEWFINGTSQGAYDLANTSITISTHPGSATTREVRYVAYVDNNGDTTPDVFCLEQEVFNFDEYPVATCQFSGASYGTIYADGATRTITVNAGNLQGRTVTEIRLYRQLVGTDPVPVLYATANPVVGNSHTFDWVNHTDLTAPNWVFRAEIDITDGIDTYSAICDEANGTGSGVGQGVGVNVSAYNPSCGIVNGGTITAPNTGNNRVPIFGNTTVGQHNHQFNRTFNLGSVATVTVTNTTWSYPTNPPNLPEVSGGGNTNNTNTVINWDLSSASVGAGEPAHIRVDMALEYRDVDGNVLGTENIFCTRTNLRIFVPALICAAPSGDLTPIPMDNNNYTRNISHSGTMGATGPIYGRPDTTTWVLEQFLLPGTPTLAQLNDDTTPGLWGFVTDFVTAGATPFNYNAFTPDTFYRLRYTVDVTDPADSCTARVLLETETAGVGFSCDQYYGGPTNNFVVATVNGANVNVTLDVDNGNGYLLQFDFFLVDENGNRILPAIHTATSAVDGDRTFSIPRTAFAYNGGNTLVGNYVMSVDVTYVNAAPNPIFAPGDIPVGASCPMTSPVRYQLGNIQATYTVTPYGVDGSGVQRYGFALGECFDVTNTSLTDLGAPTFGDASVDLLYEWVISGGGTPTANNYGLTTFAGYQPYQPAQLCFYDNGTYSLNLRGYNISDTGNPFYREGTSSQDIRVCDPQSLGISYSGTPFAGNPQTFTVSSNGEFNIVPPAAAGANNFVFTVFDDDTNTQVGAIQNSGSNVLTRSLPAGNYRVEVRRDGCLGRATAVYYFTIYGASGIAASYNFVNNINAGSAPLEVCFNDTSVSSGSGGPIVSWEWDWEGDGTYDYSYTVAEIPCHIYNTPGVYRPRLRVVNQQGQVATAQNPVRVYTQLEGQMSFTASPQGGGAWCFTPDMSNAPAGTIITGWVFDSEATPPVTGAPVTPPADGSGVACYTYGASGTYYVDMCFTDPGGSPPNDSGCVTVPVVVDLPGNNPPTLSVTPTCSLARTAQFVVRNDGPTAMANPVTAIFYNNGVQFSTATVNALANGATQTFTFPNMQGVVRIVIGAYGIDVSTTCNYAPVLTVTSVCSGTPEYPSFTLHNASAAGPNPMQPGQTYEVRNSANLLVTSGSLPVLGTGPSSGLIVTLTGAMSNAGDPYDTYTLITTGVNGNVTYTPTAPCNPRPTLQAQQFCENPVRFTITSDQPMQLAQSYELRNVTLSDTLVTSGSFTIANPAVPFSFNLPGGQNPYHEYRIRTVTAPDNGFVVPLDVTLTPCPLPTVNISAACTTGGSPNMARFTLNRTDSGTLPMIGDQIYRVYNAVTNVEITTGTNNLPLLGAGPTSGVIFTVDGTTFDPYASYRIESNGIYGNFTVTEPPCNARPTLSVDRTCANPLQVTINSNNPIVVPQGYTVVGTGISGVINPGDSLPVTVTLTGLDPYVSYQVVTNDSPNGFVNALDAFTTVCERPNLSVIHDCTMPVRFLVSNTGGAMLSASNVSLSGPSGTSIGVSTIQLTAGGDTVIEVSPATGIDPYAAYTLSIGADFNTNSTLLTSTRDCLNPVLVVTNNDCATYPLTFTVTNTGGVMQVGQSYEVRNGSNSVVMNGTLNIGAGGNQVISLDGLDPYDTYTISSSGFAGSLSGNMQNGCVAPLLEASSTCDYPATFTIRNVGGGNMMTPETFTVFDMFGGNATPLPNTFQLNVGQEFVVTLPADSNPYGLHTLESNGFSPVTHSQACLLPALNVTASCLLPVQFLVTNIGNDMLVPHSYTVMNGFGENFTPANNTFQLDSGQSLVVTVATTDLSSPITFSSSTYGINATSQINCSSAGGATVNPIVDLGDIPLVPTAPPITLDTLLLNRLSLDVLELPAWSSVPVCGHGCPIFRLYHSNQSGDWDIWRLDGADMENQISFHTNLTERDSADPLVVDAPDVTDLAPSLSPNNEWFVFSSNRDGNWEIYVAPTSGDLNYAQRVTYNEIAVDTHPVWGPLNYIVYESTRTGNWDLFMVDVVTGIEYQLTDSPSNEQSAAWSPDGSKIVYQSDVSSTDDRVDWQIYELDLLTMTVRRMTDEPNGAWDAAYSPDGNRIVYRTLADNGNSIIKVMNVNLTNVVSVTGVDENATVPVFSPSGRFLAYQSNADGDLDIYVHEFATGLTRKITDNDIDDYAPTWLCGDDRLVFTSEIYGEPNIFEVEVLPMTAPPMLVEEDAFQLTFEEYLDVYPVMNVPFERASREEFVMLRDMQYPDGLIHRGFALTIEDTSIDGIIRDDWAEMNVCPAGNFAIGGG